MAYKINLKSLQLIKETTNYWFVLCPFHSETIPSLAIHRTGDRAGQWKCYGCDAWGTLTDSEIEKLGCDKTKQIKRKTPEQWERLQQFYQNSMLLESSTFLRFCRMWNVSKNCLLNANVGFGKGKDLQPDYLTFPIRNAVGQIIGIQKRYEDDTKRFIGGSELSLFYNWPIKPQSQLLITEGVTDYLTLADWGFWAIGAASATINPQKIVDFYLTHQPESVIIVSDNDSAGLKLSYELQHRIGQYLQYDLYLKDLSLIIPPKPYKDIREWKANGLTKAMFEKLMEI